MPLASTLQHQLFPGSPACMPASQISDLPASQSHEPISLRQFTLCIRVYILLVLFLARTLVYILTTPSPRFSVSKETVSSFFPRPMMSCSFIAYSWSSMGMTALHTTSIYEYINKSLKVQRNWLNYTAIKKLILLHLWTFVHSIYAAFFFFFCLSAFPNCTYSSASTTPICFLMASLVTPSKTNLFLLSTPVLLTNCILFSNYFYCNIIY